MQDGDRLPEARSQGACCLRQSPPAADARFGHARRLRRRCRPTPEVNALPAYRDPFASLGCALRGNGETGKDGTCGRDGRNRAAALTILGKPGIVQPCKVMSGARLVM